jgi:hypothetical protein
MDVTSLIVGVGCLAAGAVAGRVRWFEKHDVPSSGAGGALDPVETLAARRRAELRVAELGATNELLRSACLSPVSVDAVPTDLAPSVPSVPSVRAVPSARELEALVSSLRGFAFVDEVLVAGAEGLTWSRGETPRARRLATLATAFGALADTLRAHGADLGEVQVVTLDAKHVVARRLPAWTRGAWLIAESTSRPPSSLALDAVVARAALLRPDVAPRDAARSPARLRGTTGRTGEGGSRVQTLVDELSRLRTVRDACAVSFTHAGRPLVTLLEDGPPSAVVDELGARMHRLHRHLARALGVAVVHTGATLTTGQRLAFVPLVDHSQCALLTLGMQPVEALDIERFTGRIRRLLAEDGDFSPRQLAPAAGTTV